MGPRVPWSPETVARRGRPAPSTRCPTLSQALGNLAHHRRRALRARVVGITGSSGKTTTKDLLKETLRGSFRVHATQGNLNNRIGLPLTLLAAPADTEVLVLEMGTNEPGEIRALTEVAEPADRRHHDGQRDPPGEAGIAGAACWRRSWISSGAFPRTGFAVVGDEPPDSGGAGQGRWCPDLRVAGWSERADAGAPAGRSEAYRTRDAIGSGGGGNRSSSGCPGRHSVQNALLALAVADALGVPPPGMPPVASAEVEARRDAERDPDPGRPDPPGGLLQRQPSEPPGRPGPPGHASRARAPGGGAGEHAGAGRGNPGSFTARRWKRP